MEYWQNRIANERRNAEANQRPSSFVGQLNRARSNGDTNSLRQNIRNDGIAVTGVLDHVVNQSPKLFHLAELANKRDPNSQKPGGMGGI